VRKRSNKLQGQRENRQPSTQLKTRPPDQHSFPAATSLHNMTDASSVKHRAHAGGVSVQRATNGSSWNK
jgi:hypothetical protein